MKFSYFILLLIFSSCLSRESTDYDRCLIIYRNTVNEFNVRITVSPVEFRENSIIGEAKIYFLRDDSCYMSFFSPYFRLNSVDAKKKQHIFLDYQVPTIPSDGILELSSFHELPFIFVDVDFDNQLEILINYSKQGIKMGNAYTVYDLNYEFGEPYYDYLYDMSRGILPLQKLDDMSIIDYSNKEISNYSYNGEREVWVKYTYRKNNDNINLDRIEDYDSLGQILARQQVIIYDTLTTYYNKREYLYQ